MAQLTLFSTITPGPQRQEVLNKVIAGKIALTVKNENEESVELSACGLTPDGDIQCHAPEGLPFPSPKSFCTVSFSVADERYLLEVRPLTSENLVILKIETFFHLQRRQNFRFKIPKGLQASLQFKEVNKKPLELKCTLTDLSNEGCSAVLPLSEASLHVDDTFSGWIVIGDLKPIAVAGHLKNLLLLGEMDLTLGIKFNHLPEASEFYILESINYLQRQAYQKKVA